MKSIRGIFDYSYYQTRIIVAFCAFTVIIVVIIARTSYIFMRDIYLDQIQSQVNTVTQMISKQIKPENLNLLSLGVPVQTAENILRKNLTGNLANNQRPEIFIFDRNLRIMVHSDPSILPGSTDTRLLLNNNEIKNLKLSQSTATLPFKGDDGRWYLWGFLRLNPEFWLAVRESAARLQKVDDFSELFWYFGSAGVLLSVILGWIMARSINHPINKLIKFSSELGKGNFEIKAPLSMHGELGILSNTMDRMRTGLAESQKEKEELLAQIAHEIRNPLGGIELLTNLTKEDLEKEKMNTDYLEKILKEISQLKKLITSYLNYSRPMPANPVWISLPALMNEISDIFIQPLRKKNAELLIDVCGDKILYDENHLKQILINLISNSLDSIGPGGEISVSACRSGSNFYIRVADNGIGISEEDKSKIFDPFYTTKKNGTGLGLAICKKLSRENKSFLVADNNQGKGAIFTITKELSDGK